MDNETLLFIDKAKGIYQGSKSILSEKTMIWHCQWHKQANILKYPNKSYQPSFLRKLQSVYEQTTYEAAKKKSTLIKKEMAILNQSTVRSLEKATSMVRKQL